MIRLSAWKKAGAVFVLFSAMAVGIRAQTFDTLLDFDYTNGANPLASLMQSTDGSLYGTNVNGGSSASLGTVFRITQAGVLTTLHKFEGPDGGKPTGALVQRADGNFYGTTGNGGLEDAGTVFRMTARGTITTIYRFCGQPNCTDGRSPAGGLTQDATDGSLYGITEGGGAEDQGTIFRITSRGTFTTVHSFDSADGSIPGGLVQATDGNFYGTTYEGGANNAGTIFRLTRDGVLTTLYTFCPKLSCTDGRSPYGALLQASDGMLYGTTEYGGTSGSGTIFKIAAGGHLTTLHNFDSIDGSSPVSGLMQATDGNFYGTTAQGGNLTCDEPYGCGTVFQLAPGGNLETLHQFDGNDGAQLTSGLAQDTNGIFYGTTYVGGSTNDCPEEGEGCGTLFSLSMGLGPFVKLTSTAGHVGQTGPVLGQGFVGTSSVSINGIQAAFTVVSDTYMTATVPPGATTGFVTVVTPSGTLTSNVPFRVLP